MSLRAPAGMGSSHAMGLLLGLLEDRTGQQIAANRAWRIETALRPILREQGLESLDQLVGKLIASTDGSLGDMVVDALLNQETFFFRDAPVLDAVLDAACELQAEQPDRRLRIWSAGCSTGQEPLSLAMLFAEKAPERQVTEPEIVATDVSAAALARARTGRYSQFEIQRGLPVRRMMAWFESDGADWTAQPDLVRKVQYRRHNLTADAPPPGRFDVILCRNVLLYFPLPLRHSVFERLALALRPGGVLVLGAGETVIGQSELFAPSERFRGFYRLAGARDERVVAPAL